MTETTTRITTLTILDMEIKFWEKMVIEGERMTIRIK